MIEDTELLRRYAEDRAEPAFAELVQRHVGVVYAAALRRVGGDAHLAEEVTQTVFTTLARKAGALMKHPVLIGWLHRSTHYAATDALRAKVQRERREQPTEPETMNANAETNGSRGREVDWEHVRPVLDSLMDKLDERDRGALLLRFFEGNSFGQIGATLRLSEDAARMRVERALEKLRVALGRRGITSTAAALGGVLANQAAVAVPAGVAASVTGAALAGAAVGTGVGVGASAGAWATFLVMSKIKIGIAGAIIVAVTIPAIVEVRANRALSAEIAALRADSSEVVALRKENQRLDRARAGATASQPDADELARTRARVAVLQKRPAGVTDATLKPASTWRNVGWATPQAALETGMWASEAGNTEEFVLHTRWIGDARVRAQAAFAELPEMIRARYGNADRMLGEFSFGSRGEENDAEMRRNYGKVTAFQVLDVTDDPRREGMRVRHWEQTAAGYEREMANTLSPFEGQFVFGQNRWNEQMWQDIVGQIDPATGAFRPRKVIPLDPATGRPIQSKR